MIGNLDYDAFGKKFEFSPLNLCWKILHPFESPLSYANSSTIVIIHPPFPAFTLLTKTA